MRIRLSCLLLGVLAAISLPCPSQQTLTPRKLLAVTVTGSQRFKPDAIAAATGLIIGMTAGEDDFRRAAERLADSGAFNDVTFGYSYTDAGSKLTLDVKDALEFVPARFEDFVGFTDDELRSRIKERLPLFDGQLPASGKLAAQVSDILQGMLLERKLPGHVEYDRMVREDGGAVQAILYSIEGVSILIHQATVSGAGPDEMPRLQAAANRLKGRDYRRSALDFVVEKQLLPVFHERGYLKATVDTLPPKLAAPPAESEEDATRTTFVDIEFTVDPGARYRLTGVEWAGNKSVSAAKLSSLLRARNGEMANTVELAADLDHARQLYGSLGYIRAAIEPVAQFDESAGTVKYTLNVSEDEQYKMGELDIRGVDRAQEQKLRDLWKLRAGDVYNAGALQAFLPEAVKALPRNLDWTTTHHVTANVRDKTVDVEIHFTAQALK